MSEQHIQEKKKSLHVILQIRYEEDNASVREKIARLHTHGVDIVFLCPQERGDELVSYMTYAMSARLREDTVPNVGVTTHDCSIAPGDLLRDGGTCRGKVIPVVYAPWGGIVPTGPCDDEVKMLLAKTERPRYFGGISPRGEGRYATYHEGYEFSKLVHTAYVRGFDAVVLGKASCEPPSLRDVQIVRETIDNGWTLSLLVACPLDVQCIFAYLPFVDGIIITEYDSPEDILPIVDMLKEYEQ